MTQDQIEQWVDLHQGMNGMWTATSVLVPGLRVTEKSRELVFESLPIVLASLAQATRLQQYERK